MAGILADHRQKECINNVGGNNTLFIFKYENYSRSQIKVTDNVLVTFPDVDVYELNSLNIGFSENIEEEDGGVVYSQNGSFDLVKIKSTDNFKYLASQDFRILIKDNNENYRLIGLETGLKLKFTKESGTNLSDFNGFKFSFDTKEENTAPFVNDLNFFNVVGYLQELLQYEL